MTLYDWQNEVWKLMEQKGFHEGRGNSRDDMLVRLCLVGTEVSEAAQEVKRHWTDRTPLALKEKVAEELADVIYRVLDLGACIGVNLEESLASKHRANRLRPAKYGTPQESKA